jgi:hypothetical protein
VASVQFLKQGNLPAVDKDFSKNVRVKPYDLYPVRSATACTWTACSSSAMLTLNVTGSFAKREMDTTIPAADETRLFLHTRQFDLFAGLTLDLPRQWQARLDSGFGRSDVSYQRTTITGSSASTAPPTDTNSESRYLDLVADGELFSLPAGGVRAAFGAGYRRDGYELIDHRGLEKPLDLHRTIRSAFGELNIPLLKDMLPGVRSLSLHCGSAL